MKRNIHKYSYTEKKYSYIISSIVILKRNIHILYQV